ncbi:Gfo/Idh/MocA family oxidoreductase, partial [bacterium]|nr:Gfo/Idh/MocA family oxidoreductase [bacterium]
MKSMNRRDFLRKSGLAAAAMGLGAHALGPHIVSRAEGARTVSASEKILVALIGCGGMGSTDLYGMMGTGMVEVVAVCDVDDSHSARVAKEVESRQGKAPKVEKDFRRVIANRDIDAVVVGTPDHWHALVTVYACRAGKDVYVEKPLSHEIAEGLAMIRAARQNKR